VQGDRGRTFGEAFLASKYQFVFIQMAACIRFEDRLEGISNYLQWKVRMTALLKENRLWSHANTVVPVPTNDPIALDVHEVREAKAQRLILDGVKDPLIPHLAEKKTANDMWETLKKLYEAKNENRKMALKIRLHDIKMAKGESVVSYLTRVAQVKDELAAVGETISDSELVRIALKGFTKEWEVFVKCVVGRENLPDWSRLWDDFTQEELRERGDQRTDECVDENAALVNKGKRKGNSKKDLSKVRCFRCNQMGHLASQCPEKKKGKEKEKSIVSSEEVGNFAEEFEREFALVTIITSVGSSEFVRNSGWVIDSGASHHMTGAHYVFHTFLSANPVRQVVGENGAARIVRGAGRARFRLESGDLLDLEGVLLVPGLRVSLLSISALEDAGYVVFFRKNQVYIYRMGANPEPMMIGKRVGRLYFVRGQPTVAGWISGAGSDEEQMAPEAAVGPRIQPRIPREETESLLSTGRRASRSDGTNAQGVASSGFPVAVSGGSSGSSSVQVLGMAPGSEGAPTALSMIEMKMEPADVGDDSEYLPR